MTGLIARLPRARTTLIIALSFLTLAFATNASSAQRAQPHRTASPQAHAKVVKKQPTHRKNKAVKHRRAKRTNAARPHPAAKPRLLASCGYSPRAVRALHSRAAYVLDVDSGTPLLARNARTVRPIASISKLMTAVVARDADRPLNGSRAEPRLSGRPHRVREGDEPRSAPPRDAPYAFPRTDRAVAA